MRISSPPHVFLKCVILIFSFLIFISGCGKKGADPEEIQVNPNLKFLTAGYPIDHFDGNYSTEFPTWSLDGSKIYFLNVIGFWQYAAYEKRQIWSIDTAGINSSLLFEGPFVGLNLSPDGSKLVTNINRETLISYPGGTPLLIDINSGEMDTLEVDSSLLSLYLEFTPSGDSLIYFATFLDSLRGNIYTNYYWGAFYAFDLIERTNHMLFMENPALVAGMAITPDGRQIIAAGKIRNLDGGGERELQNVGVWPTVSASGDTIISGFGPWLLRSTSVVMTDLTSESKLKELFLFKGEQYVYAEFRLSPNGCQLIICSTHLLQEGTGMDFGHHVLYILTEL